MFLKLKKLIFSFRCSILLALRLAGTHSVQICLPMRASARSGIWKNVSSAFPVSVDRRSASGRTLMHAECKVLSKAMLFCGKDMFSSVELSTY
jgi:hypothetical protein